MYNTIRTSVLAVFKSKNLYHLVSGFHKLKTNKKIIKKIDYRVLNNCRIIADFMIRKTC